MGVTVVGIFPSNEEVAGDIRSSLVGVERRRLPPVRHRLRGRRRRGGGGGGGRRDRVKEVSDERLLLRGPPTVPDNVDVNGGVRKNWAHVVFKLD